MTLDQLKARIVIRQIRLGMDSPSPAVWAAAMARTPTPEQRGKVKQGLQQNNPGMVGEVMIDLYTAELRERAEADVASLSETDPISVILALLD